MAMYKVKKPNRVKQKDGKLDPLCWVPVDLGVSDRLGNSGKG